MSRMKISPVRLSSIEVQIMESVWAHSPISVREIQERLSGGRAYTTVQTAVSRLEQKGALRRVRKIGNAYVYEAAVERKAAHRRLMDDFLALFGGHALPIVAHWIETRKLTREDLRAAEDLMKERMRKP